MKGFLATIGGIVVVLFALALCTAGNMASNFSGSNLKSTGHNVSSSSGACDTADKRERESADALNNGHYQKAYDTVVSGLHYVELCQDDDDNLVNKAYLMSFKASAEHHLSSGDSRTDLNEANQLLVECETRPSLYGTHVAAQCETQENTNITEQTNWDMENY